MVSACAGSRWSRGCECLRRSAGRAWPTDWSSRGDAGSEPAPREQGEEGAAEVGAHGADQGVLSGEFVTEPAGERLGRRVAGEAGVGHPRLHRQHVEDGGRAPWSESSAGRDQRRTSIHTSILTMNIYHVNFNVIDVRSAIGCPSSPSGAEAAVAVEDSVPQVTSEVSGAPSAPEIVHTDLRRGSVGLAGVLMQSVAQISPTLGIFYTIAFNTGQAGVTAPLTYLAAFVVCLIIAVPMTELARHLPSAGGFYTYVSHGIGPRWGFITGWLYAIMVTIVPAALAAFTGAVLHDELSTKYGFGLAVVGVRARHRRDLLRLRLPRHRHLGALPGRHVPVRDRRRAGTVAHRRDQPGPGWRQRGRLQPGPHRQLVRVLPRHRAVDLRVHRFRVGRRGRRRVP